jgi:hypothetical protein
MPADPPVTLVVMLEESADVPAVQKALEQAGVAVLQRLDNLGIILSRGPAQSITDIIRIDGVRAVEEDREIKLPDPGSPS